MQADCMPFRVAVPQHVRGRAANALLGRCCALSTPQQRRACGPAASHDPGSSAQLHSAADTPAAAHAVHLWWCATAQVGVCTRGVRAYIAVAHAAGECTPHTRHDCMHAAKLCPCLSPPTMHLAGARVARRQPGATADAAGERLRGAGARRRGAHRAPACQGFCAADTHSLPATHGAAAGVCVLPLCVQRALRAPCGREDLVRCGRAQAAAMSDAARPRVLLVPLPLPLPLPCRWHNPTAEV
jgi:hypothetical protein